MPLTALIGYNPAAMPNLFKASLVLALAASVPTSLHDEFNSQQAFAYLAQIAGFCERWPGSPGQEDAGSYPTDIKEGWSPD